MRTINISSFIAICIFIGGLGSSQALADEFTCRDIILTRKIADAAIVQNPFPKQTILHLNIDRATPGRSSLSWSGNPTMEGVTSVWPDDTHIIVERGVIAVSLAVFKDGIWSVGTVTLDAMGQLRATESTLAPQGVIFDVVEAKCQEGHE